MKREKTKTGITGEFCGEKAYGQKSSGFDESVYLTFKIELTEMLIHDKAAKMAGLQVKRITLRPKKKDALTVVLLRESTISSVQCRMPSRHHINMNAISFQ